VAHISASAVSSAMMRVSVGPASRSMPTRPNSWRLASATKGVAGADEHVDWAIVSVPRAHGGDGLDASEKVDFVGAAQGHGGDGGGGGDSVQWRGAGGDRGTPATLAVSTDMWAEATIG